MKRESADEKINVKSKSMEDALSAIIIFHTVIQKSKCPFGQVIVMRPIMEVIMGDKFENISNATIVNRSFVQNAFNKVKSEYDEETAQALKKVAEEIEKSKNTEAAENFNSFNEELQKPEPKKSILRTLWAGVTNTLPSILQMTDIVAKISKLFTS
jgi:hypothetical protein